jgi:hypothetical protein
VLTVSIHDIKVKVKKCVINTLSEQLVVVILLSALILTFLTARFSSYVFDFKICLVI